MIPIKEYDDELERLKALKKLAEEINSIEIDKLFVDSEQVAKALRCCERRAKDLMRSPGFPSINLGNKPVVNVFALAEYCKQRIDYEEMKKGKQL